MKIAIQGTNSFNDYPVFLRAMGVALAQMKDEDKEFIVFSSGPLVINQFALEFLNVTERSLKARGIKTRLVKVPPSHIKKIIHEISYLAYFSKPKEPVSELVDLAEAKDIEVGVYRF